MNKKEVSSYVATERKAITVAFITGILSAGISFFYFQSEAAPLFGRYSVGIVAALLAAFVTLVLFLVGWKLPHRKSESTGRKVLHATTYWVKRSAVALVHAGLLFLLVSGLFYMLAAAFKGFVLNPFPSVLAVGLLVAGVSYMVYPLVARLTLLNLSSILAAFLVAGVLTSAMTMQDPYWWQLHFSSLGAGNPVTAFTFNITLILAGIVIVTITELMTDKLAVIAKEKGYKDTKGISTVRWLLVATGTGLAFVGVFPFDTHLTMHNISASGMIFLFLALIIGIKKFVPFFDTSFYAASLAMLIGVVVAVVLFLNSVFNLTAMEMIAAGVIFSWFIVFIRQIASLDPGSKVEY